MCPEILVKLGNDAEAGPLPVYDNLLWEPAPLRALQLAVILTGGNYPAIRH